MSLKIDLKKILKKEFTESPPKMDIDRMRDEFLTWLAQLKLPADADVSSWLECVKVFRPEPGEGSLESGRRIRIALRLYTRENQYLLSISESLNPENRGVYTMAVHVNWQDREKHMQELVEKSYTGKFNDSLRAKHTLWAQTFRMEEIQDAFNSCAIAMLGNELVGRKDSRIDTTPLGRRPSPKVTFPEPE
ncbi:MAG: hypothetical protein PHU88_09370 [candidate division Zixibacteria bacterium]|nr:hypothetical protein [candidate division Zixibacteria bacterium]MDD5425698.1 hypothetical protein [candidate division Zixibacteria bacterium]